jgi:hypothetical protein
MTLDGEHARRVVEFLADVLADALEGAAAMAVAVVGLVVDQGARKLRRQGGTFGFCQNSLNATIGTSDNCTTCLSWQAL